MPSTSSQPVSGTSNRDAYRKSFLRHVHCLMQLGYESLAPANFTSAEEDDITGEICKRMKQLTEDAPSEKWMTNYSIHDQDPLNERLSPVTGKIRRGKRRPRLDIRLVNKQSIPNPRFCIEAKRLYSSNSVSDYIDDEGLGAFVCGYYAESDNAAGMVGYVQRDSIADWLPKLQKKLLTDTGLQMQANGDAWSLSPFKKGPQHTYRSKHNRSKNLPAIEVFHTFFIFC